MIPYADQILSQARTSAQAAFSEITVNVATGDDKRAVAEASVEAALKIKVGNDPVESLVRSILQATMSAGGVEGLRPEPAYLRAMGQICKELAFEVSIMTEEGRAEKFEDCSGLIADEPLKIAVCVAASHLISSAARYIRTFDEQKLVAFITAELDEGNAFMEADVLAMTAAAQ